METFGEIIYMFLSAHNGFEFVLYPRCTPTISAKFNGWIFSSRAQPCSFCYFCVNGEVETKTIRRHMIVKMAIKKKKKEKQVKCKHSFSFVCIWFIQTLTAIESSVRISIVFWSVLYWTRLVQRQHKVPYIRMRNQRKLPIASFASHSFLTFAIRNWRGVSRVFLCVFSFVLCILCSNRHLCCSH